MCNNVAEILWQHCVPYVNTLLQEGLAARLREQFYVTCEVKSPIETMLHVTRHVKAARVSYVQLNFPIIFLLLTFIMKQFCT